MLPSLPCICTTPFCNENNISRWNFSLNATVEICQSRWTDGQITSRFCERCSLMLMGVTQPVGNAVTWWSRRTCQWCSDHVAVSETTHVDCVLLANKSWCDRCRRPYWRRRPILLLAFINLNYDDRNIHLWNEYSFSDVCDLVKCSIGRQSKRSTYRFTGLLSTPSINFYSVPWIG